MKTRRRVSPWFPYRNEGSWQDLAPRADIVDSVSLFGELPDREFLAKCREHGVAVLKLVGGDASAFDTNERARTTVEGYVRECQEPGFDGIDLDFEHIPSELTPRYASFVQRTADELHRMGKRLSICVHGVPLSMYESARDWLFYDTDVIGEACDEVRVMCYDMRFAPHTWFGPTSTKPWAREVMVFWQDNIPGEKLIMGLPAYCNDYDATPGSENGRQGPAGSPACWPGAQDVESVWLDYERVHVCRYRDEKGGTRLCFATDADSTRAHLQTAEELDIPGVGFWHWGIMTPSIWQAVYEWLGPAC